ncbi:MAG: ABC transporter permease [Lachnospiraceae bacterium]|nr:ABC transporter permease [Lachnospiraceae bacterium]
MKILFRYIRKNMMEKKGRLLLVILSVAISAGLLVACVGMMDTIKDSFSEPTRRATEGREVALSSVEGAWFTENDFDAEGLTDLQGEITGTGVISKDDKLYYVTLHGQKSFSGVLKSGQWADDGTAACIVSERTAKERNLSIGSELTLSLYGEPVTFTVKAIAVTDGVLYADSKETFGVIVSYRFMNEKAGSPDAYNVMYAKVATGKSGKTATADQIKDAVDRFNEINTSVKAADRTNSLFFGDISSLILSVGLVLGIVIIVSILIISGVFKMIISERIPVFGTFLSQDSTKRQLRFIVLLESACYALLAGIVGSALGEGILFLVNRLVSPLREYGIYLPFRINWLHVLFGIAFAVVISVVAAWLPVRRIAGFETKDVILNRVESTHKKHTVRTVIGLLLFASSIVITLLLDGEISPLSIVAASACYIGIIMAAPALIKVLMTFFCKVFRGNTTMWLACNNIRTSRLLISNIVLLIIALNGILSCSSTGRTMTKVVIEAYEELEYDFEVDNILPSGSDESSYDRILKELQTNPYVDQSTVSPQAFRIAEHEGTRILATAVEPEPYAKYNQYMHLMEDKYRESYLDFSNAEDDTILVTTALARDMKLKEGDTLKLSVNGITHEWRIACIADGKLLNSGKFILFRRSDYVDVYHDSEVEGFSFKIKGDKDAAEASFKSLFTSYGATYSDRDTRMQDNVDQNAMIVNLISIFSYLAIAISAIGIFNNIVISFNQRRKEFAMMASVGMNGSKRKKLVLSESILCVVIAVIIAVPFTLLTNRLVTGMLYYIGTPFDILYDWKGTPSFLAAFVGIVFIASLSTMRRSKNLSVVNELKYE